VKDAGYGLDRLIDRAGVEPVRAAEHGDPVVGPMTAEGFKQPKENEHEAKPGASHRYQRTRDK
jgi:hypothetical protein